MMMFKVRVIFIATLTILSCHKIYAQLPVELSAYRMNAASLNPARNCEDNFADFRLVFGSSGLSSNLFRLAASVSSQDKRTASYWGRRRGHRPWHTAGIRFDAYNSENVITEAEMLNYSFSLPFKIRKKKSRHFIASIGTEMGVTRSQLEESHETLTLDQQISKSKPDFGIGLCLRDPVHTLEAGFRHLFEPRTLKLNSEHKGYPGQFVKTHERQFFAGLKRKIPLAKLFNIEPQVTYLQYGSERIVSGTFTGVINLPKGRKLHVVKLGQTMDGTKTFGTFIEYKRSNFRRIMSARYSYFTDSRNYHFHSIQLNYNIGVLEILRPTGFW